MSAKAPDVASWIDCKQRLRALADLVDVVDLPRRMVEERHGSVDQPDIVVVGAAAKEGDHPGAGVADLESEHVGEEADAGVEVGGGVQHVAELARPSGTLIEDRRSAGSRASRVARRVHRLPVVWLGLHDARSHRDLGADADNWLSHRNAAVVVIDHDDVMRSGRATDAGDVVGVVGGESELDQLSVRCLDNPQLVASVGGGEHAVVTFGKAELPVELPRRIDVGHAERHLGKAMHRHR